MKEKNETNSSLSSSKKTSSSKLPLQRTLSDKISSKKHIFRVTSRVECSLHSVLFTPGTRKRVYMLFKRVLV